MTDVTPEPKLRAGSAEYETDVIKRARKAASNVGKTLENYKLMGEALSIMRKRAMKEAGLQGSNKQPAGPKYTKALNEELAKAPEFDDPSVFESGSARTHCLWMHDHKDQLDWTLDVCERQKPGSTRRWNNPTYIWKQYRRLTKEPTKAALDAKAKKERKAEETARELEDYREHWKRKYDEVAARLEAMEFSAPAEKPKRVKRTPKGKDGEADEAGGYAQGVLEAITGNKRVYKRKLIGTLDEVIGPSLTEPTNT